MTNLTINLAISAVFLLSKLFALVTEPLVWVAALLLVNLLVAHHPGRSRASAAMALLLVLMIGWLPLPDMLIRNLESEYAELPPGTDLQGYVGLIVLGGSTESSEVAHAHTQPLLNGAGERQAAPIWMIRANPHLRLLYTGGGGELGGHSISEADRAKVFFDAMGLSSQTVQYESKSRTTYENATMSAKLPGVDIRQRWLLVTSAWHMPRAAATFRKVGWNVTPYPVDFRTGKDTSWTAYSLQAGVAKWELVAHEILGNFAYRMSGWI